MNMRNLLIPLLLIANFSVYSLPTAKITLRVIDEEGTPVVNAKLGVGISKRKTSGLGVDDTILPGLTDSNGLFTAKGSTEPYVGFRVNKEGYYQTLGRFREFTGISGVYGFRKWQPWNPTIDVVLKKVVNPIPMYVGRMTGKRVTGDSPQLILPGEGKFFGYDLIAKDWVVPYGQGLHSDFIFKVDVDHYNGGGDYDLSLILKFTSPDDGIQSFYAQNQYSKKGGSALQSPHHAPIEGYQDQLIVRDLQIKDRIYKRSISEDQNYFFRVRTKRNDQGKIIEAYYGKIYGGIDFSIPKEDEKGDIYFTFYLNPNNNDTNVEFSPKKNLFPKPKDLRGVYRFNP